MYCENEISERTAKQKRKFLAVFAIDLLALIGGIVFLALDINSELFFRGIIIIVFSLLFMWRIFEKYSPKTLFSKGFKGENIKEDVYEVYVRRGVALRPKQVGMPYGGRPLSHTRMSKSILRSAVYLKLDNGDIKEIRGMRVEHVELYEDGDTLQKYPGTKYPVIINRESARQPCPICGTINLMTDVACITCNLAIKTKIEKENA